jgi:hypothetical protein
MHEATVQTTYVDRTSSQEPPSANAALVRTSGGGAVASPCACTRRPSSPASVAPFLRTHTPHTFVQQQHSQHHTLVSRLSVLACSRIKT